MRVSFATFLTTRLLPVVAGALLTFAAAAQPGNGGTRRGWATGGASLLLASGVAYGLRHLRKRHQARQG